MKVNNFVTHANKVKLSSLGGSVCSTECILISSVLFLFLVTFNQQLLPDCPRFQSDTNDTVSVGESLNGAKYQQKFLTRNRQKVHLPFIPLGGQKEEEKKKVGDILSFYCTGKDGHARSDEFWCDRDDV